MCVCATSNSPVAMISGQWHHILNTHQNSRGIVATLSLVHSCSFVVCFIQNKTNSVAFSPQANYTTLPNFLRSSGSGTGSTQPLWGQMKSYLKEKYRLRSRKLRSTTVGDLPHWPHDTSLSTNVVLYIINYYYWSCNCIDFCGNNFLTACMNILIEDSAVWSRNGWQAKTCLIVSLKQILVISINNQLQETSHI
jgi:hypothetical protein